MKLATEWSFSTFVLASVFFRATTCLSFITLRQISPRQAFGGQPLRLKWITSVSILQDVNPLNRNDARCRRGLKLSVSSSTEHDDAVVLSFGTAMEHILQLVKHNDTSPVIIEGRITTNRPLGSSFGFLDIAGEGDELVQLMFKRQDYQGKADGLLKCLNRGMRIRVKGVASATGNPGQGVLLIHFLEIKGLPPNPQHVRGLLRMVANGRLEVDQVAPGANMTASELNSRIQDATLVGDDYDALAKELLSWSSARKPGSTQSGAVSIDRESRRNFPAALTYLQQIPLLGKPLKRNTTETLAIQSVSQLRLCDAPNELNKSSLVALKGWVQNRRRFRDSITVLEVTDTLMAMLDTDSSTSQDNNEANRFPCVLHPDLVNDEAASVYGALLCAGSRVLLEGYVVEQESTPTLWVTSIELLRCSWRPTIVRHLIELLVAENFDEDEGANALQLSPFQVTELQQMDLTERQWRSTEISHTLQGSHTRTGHVTPEMLRVLASFQQLRDNFPIKSEDSLTPATENVTGRHDPFLTTNLPGTWWQRKKRPQLEFVGWQIQKVVQSHPDYGTRKVRILDIGGGKGVLATYLAQILGDTVQLQVIDIAGGAIKNGMMRSKRLDLSVKYSVGDASHFTDEADVVVALHACGTLSDVALGHAVNHGASFVVCPCCFRSNPHLRVPVHPDRRRDREFLSAHEWLGVDADYFDTIKSLAEVQGDARLASEAMHTICAMRAAAVQRHSEKRKESLRVSIKTFPISFSTRNFCIVGTKERNSRWSH